MLVGRNYQPSNLVRQLPKHAKNFVLPGRLEREAWMGEFLRQAEGWSLPRFDSRHCAPVVESNPELEELLYLFACHLEWEKRAEPSAAWELISAARDPREDMRLHARSLLEKFKQTKPAGEPPEEEPLEIPDAESAPVKLLQIELSSMTLQTRKPPVSEKVISDLDFPKIAPQEASLKTPYNLEIIESCVGCNASRNGFFCRFSPSVLRSLNAVSHHTIMPPSAVLFVEGQTPRGVYIVCSGTVKLSTSSKEGKVLILKQAVAGEVLGLSAAISGTNYEMTAETACPCQLNFVSRQDLITLLQNQSEAGVHAALSLSREFQGAYRDIHDLLLARSSSGKLARLLLSCAPPVFERSQEKPLRPVMTHEEMAQRIGSSRETVTRLLSDLKRRKLIRPSGASLVIRDRTALQALTL